jgi:hypothetical protein
LSSRPRGWSVRGVEQMSKLRIYKKNGGNVYDLVMRQKKEKEKEKKQEIQDELRKRYRSAARRYYDVWNGDIPIVSKGKVTGAYTALKSTIGRCG